MLAGREDYFATRVMVNGRRLTVMVALEGHDPTAPPSEREPATPEYDHSKRIKPGWPGGSPAPVPVIREPVIVLHDG